MIIKATLTLEIGSQAAMKALSVSMKVGKQVDVVFELSRQENMLNYFM